VRWLRVALLLLLAAGLVSAQTAGPIRVGTYANEPLVSRDAGGAPQGIYELGALKADKRSAYYRTLNVWIEGVRSGAGRSRRP